MGFADLETTTPLALSDNIIICTAALAQQL